MFKLLGACRSTIPTPGQNQKDPDHPSSHRNKPRWLIGTAVGSNESNGIYGGLMVVSWDLWWFNGI